jgi:hypothetical protein
MDSERERLLRIMKHPALASLPSFQQGFFYVQDPSTLLAVEMLDPNGCDQFSIFVRPRGQDDLHRTKDEERRPDRG